MFQRKRIFVLISCVCRGLAWMIIRMFEIPSWPIQRSTSAVSAETCANAMDAQTVFGSLSSSPSEYCSHCPMKNTLRPTITNTFLELNTGKSKIKCQPRTTSVHSNFVPSLKHILKERLNLGSFQMVQIWPEQYVKVKQKLFYQSPPKPKIQTPNHMSTASLPNLSWHRKRGRALNSTKHGSARDAATECVTSLMQGESLCSGRHDPICVRTGRTFWQGTNALPNTCRIWVLISVREMTQLIEWRSSSKPAWRPSIALTLDNDNMFACVMIRHENPFGNNAVTNIDCFRYSGYKKYFDDLQSINKWDEKIIWKLY